MDHNSHDAKESPIESVGLREVGRFAARNKLWIVGAPLLVLALTVFL